MNTRSGKKGQVEVQFNWIFVLIVGAILLAFFVTIALRQKEASEVGLTADFFINFEKALSGISASKGKTLLYDIPSMELRYDCIAGCDCAAYSGTSRARSTITPFAMNNQIIFSPNHLKGNKLLTLSKDWEYPYRVANFLFITSPEVKYLIEDSTRGSALFDELPPEFIEQDQAQQPAFTKELFSVDEPITGIQGNYKVKFVFFTSDPLTFTIPSAALSLPNSDVTAVKITQSGSSGSVSFYVKEGNSFKKTGDSYLFGETTAFASIFAEDLQAYSCMMNRAFKKYATVTSIYSKKQSEYFDYYNCVDENPSSEFKSVCCGSYDSSALSSLQGALSSFDFSRQDTSGLVATIQNSITSFSAQNLNAIQESCPHIY